MVLCFAVVILYQFSQTSRVESASHKTHNKGVILSGSSGQAFNYLKSTMDVFHNTFDVYTDLGAAGNHFSALGMIPDETAAVGMNQCCTETPLSGSTCIQCTFQSQVDNYGGYYFLNGTLTGSDTEPQANWGDQPDAGFDLSGATVITFYARGENGGEKVEFFVGGCGWGSDDFGNSTVPIEPYPDSFPKVKTGIITLTQEWTQYDINLQGNDLSYVLSGFGWVATAANNNFQNITFYLDEIKWDKGRPEELRLLLSYETNPTQEDFEVIMRNVAFSYDNALALLAFLASGTADDLGRASILADGFVHAIHHDRFYTGIWLRNAYMAGDLIQFPGWTPNHREETARMPGFWNCDDDSWYEDRFQVSIHTGNVGWVIIALVTSYRVLGDTDYLQAAIELGEWVETHCKDNRGSGGYTGGYEGWEPNHETLLYKSTEHNLDLYVGFQRLFAITADEKWHQRAIHAENFVKSMWDESEGKFYTGTDDTGITVNQEVIPLDAQTWPILAFRNQEHLYLRALDYAEGHHRIDSGYDFNTDRDGIWYEGTAQMAVAYQAVGQTGNSAAILTAIEEAQLESGAIPAASKDGLTTGFYLPDGSPWLYYHRGHVGASAWYLFAKLAVNPYWIGETTPVKHADFNGDGITDILWRYYGTGGYNAVWLKGTNPTDLSNSISIAAENNRIGSEMESMKLMGETAKVVEKVDMNFIIQKPIRDGFEEYNSIKEIKSGQIMSQIMASSVSDPRDDPQAVELPAVADQNWKLAGTGDFNGDGKIDIVWSNVSTAHNCVWYMNGTTFAGYAQLPDGSTTDWVLGGVGDFDRDGNPDLIWHNEVDGRNGMWYLDGVQLKGIDIMTTGANVEWKLCGTGDFNNDGHVDLVWRNPSDGRNAVWYMDGVQLSSVGWLDSVADQNWKLRGTGDFNNDGKIDLIWTYISDGRNCIWYLDGVTLTGVEFLTTVTDTDWKIVN
jgi:hypothetical protein